jgi:hypothetical protein
MSYEGYVQYLCKVGHGSIKDCYEDDLKVCKCGEPIVWCNYVDVTNGSFEGRKRIDGYINLKVKSQKTCPHCKTILETFFYIPKNKGQIISPQQERKIK